jgi:hypothetical protein
MKCFISIYSRLRITAGKNKTNAKGVVSLWEKDLNAEILLWLR